MKVEFKFLFNPISIKNLILKNRIVMAPMVNLFANPDGSVSRRTVNYYKERARGGPSLIIVETCFLDELYSKGFVTQLGIHSDSMLPGLNELSETIKAYGVAAGIQIAHCGIQRPHFKYPLLAPSAIPWEATGITPKEMTIEEIEKTIVDFGEAARRAKQAGFDLIEIHGAHGYLITGFLSPETNRRTDKYGRTLENRMRFGLEVVREIRKKVGNNFPLGFRMNGSDYIEGGITLEEAKETAKSLESEGIDVLHISAGTYKTRHLRMTSMYLPPANNVWLAEEIKKVVKIPVIASGSINDPIVAEEIIKTGKADLISLARQLLADPYWPKKVKQGRIEDILRCIRCNDGCLVRLLQGIAIRCTINPETGREEEYKIGPAERVKKVFVVGGGPAGMEAARILALRGHKTTLFEKENMLGGQLLAASVPDFKKDLKNLLNYLSTQIQKLKINIVLGNEITTEFIEERKPDVVVVATGATQKIPKEFQGIKDTFVATAMEVLMGKKQVGEKVVIVGSGLIGCETAWHLAEQGKKVTLTDIRDLGEIMSDIEGVSRIVITMRFKELGVRIIPSVKLEEIGKKRISFIDKGWNKISLEGMDNVIMATGFEPCGNLYNEIKDKGFEVYAIGDCIKPRKIFTAIHEAAHIAREI